MQSQVNEPYSVFVTPNGEVFFADRMNNRVRKILQSGETVTICGTGVYGYNGDDQPATLAQLKEPSSIFVSTRNEVYISEAACHRIRKILTNGRIVTVAGTGQAGYNGDGIEATSAKLYDPFGIFVTEQDELYIADYGNNRIRKVCNGIITTVVGNGSDKPSIVTPSSVFVSKSGEIYISEHSGHQITKVNSNGTMSIIAGTGYGGYIRKVGLATDTYLHHPWIVTVFNGEVYIADFSNHRIGKILQSGQLITIAGTCAGGYNGDGILATSAELNGPTGLFVTDGNEIYISEYYGQRIRKINSQGIISTIAGNGTRGYSGDVPFDWNEIVGTAKHVLLTCHHSIFLILVFCMCINHVDRHS